MKSATKGSRLFCQLILAGALIVASGCALLPLRAATVAGDYNESIGFNMGATLVLKAEGSYERKISMTYCTPLIVQKEDGTQEPQLMGWTNTETGKWELAGERIILQAEDRQIENPNCEKEYFEDNRSFVVVRELSGISLIGFFNKNPVKLKRHQVRKTD